MPSTWLERVAVLVMLLLDGLSIDYCLTLFLLAILIGIFSMTCIRSMYAAVPDPNNTCVGMEARLFSSDAEFEAGAEAESEPGVRCSCLACSACFGSQTAQLPFRMDEIYHDYDALDRYGMTVCPTLVALRKEAHARQVYSTTPTSCDFLGAGVLTLEVLESSIPSIAASTETCTLSGMDPNQAHVLPASCQTPSLCFVL